MKNEYRLGIYIFVSIQQIKVLYQIPAVINVRGSFQTKHFRQQEEDVSNVLRCGAKGDN